jgi:glycosyltransferase involved in cell wall biosynthesis
MRNFISKKKIIAIIGTAGVPANYGGFETLAENLVRYHKKKLIKDKLIVYCSSKNYPSKDKSYYSASLKYIPFDANGAQSILYDITSLFFAVWNRSNVILLLGVSGAIALPLVRLFSSVRIITNIDGIEWRREKWKGLAKHYLRFSEKLAVLFSHEVIVDNPAIKIYVKQAYKVDTHLIAYGGNHSIEGDSSSIDKLNLPNAYAFSVCRIEPENNLHLILDAYTNEIKKPLVIVGNWNSSNYGRELRRLYEACENFYLLDPIYDSGKLKALRSRASVYLHGHSAGGTNPSLVEAMFSGLPIIAFDCIFNKYTTENKALFFKSSSELKKIIQLNDKKLFINIGLKMLEIAKRKYCWTSVAKQYFKLIIA